MKSIKVCEYSRSRSFHYDLILQDQASGERSQDQWSSGSCDLGLSFSSMSRPDRFQTFTSLSGPDIQQHFLYIQYFCFSMSNSIDVIKKMLSIVFMFSNSWDYYFNHWHSGYSETTFLHTR